MELKGTGSRSDFSQYTFVSHLQLKTLFHFVFLILKAGYIVLYVRVLANLPLYICRVSTYGIPMGQFPLLQPNHYEFSINLLGHVHVADFVGFLP